MCEGEGGRGMRTGNRTYIRMGWDGRGEVVRACCLYAGLKRADFCVIYPLFFYR